MRETNAREQNTRAEKLAREILIAYPQGLFPMAHARNDESYHWYLPEKRGIFLLDKFHLSRSTMRDLRRRELEFRQNYDFEAVIDGCAARDETWISHLIKGAFLILHEAGFAHSQEVYEDGKLIGGVYGLALGGAFFGESMFSNATNGSKFALFALVERLKAGGFTLFDTQYLTPHLASLGAIEVSKSDYSDRLGGAIMLSGNMSAMPSSYTVSGISGRDSEQDSTQTS